MKKMTFRTVLIGAALLAATGTRAQNTNVAINATGAAAAPSAILDVSSTTRGLLIPRMTLAQRGAIATPADGLMIYQTDANPGFYYHMTGVWNRIEAPTPVWHIRGNAGTNPAINFLGTTDTAPLRFCTNGNLNNRIWITGSAIAPLLAGNVGINTTGPQERLDVNGQLRLLGTSATNNAGTIRWNAAGYHEGNVDGTATGWKKLQNDYNEVFGATYNQAGIAVCPVPGAGTNGAAIGFYGTLPPGSYTPTSADPTAMPWVGLTAARARRQYLIRASELNVEQVQWGGAFTTALKGLCAGQPIDAISVYVTSTQASAKTLLGLNVTIRHTQQNTVTGFIDLTTPVDPALVCYSGATLNHPTAPGWVTFTFGSPFVWNGLDNILIDFCYGTGTLNQITPTIWTTSVPYACTYGKYAGAVGSCGLPNVGGCGTSTFGCGMDAACAGTVTSAGSTGVRPVFLFSGQIAQAPAGVVGPPGGGKYVHYNGGFIVETTANWSTQTVPFYAFKGPGRVVAERGVFDNGVRLNDHVFDRYFDGRVSASDALLFGDRRHFTVDEMSNYVERERHLPTMKGRTAWQREGGFSLGDVNNQLWVTAETQALYLTELHDQLDVLRILATNEPLSPVQMDLIRSSICTMGELTESEKDRLIRSCAQRVVTARAR
ncbi:MAG: hypothetical protein JNM31_10715 [Flavobacteriales bacterium]|nr:hypothetical protein [Flavobacteriales bacterium]